MSVIVKDSTCRDDSCFVFTKGSPEKICKLSNPETIPKNFDLILRQFTMLGLRVLAMGYKTVDETEYPNM
jgi:magnesium-transporting ATPase (P-type)